MEVQELVYSSLLDELAPEYKLPWVQPVFIPGHPCYEEYEYMHEVYAHLRERFGIEEEDKMWNILSMLCWPMAKYSHWKCFAVEDCMSVCYI